MTANNSCVFVGQVASEPLFRLREKGIPENTPPDQKPALLQFDLWIEGPEGETRARLVAFNAVARQLYAQVRQGMRAAIQCRYRKRRKDPDGEWIHEFVMESLTVLDARPLELPARRPREQRLEVQEEELAYDDSTFAP
jgi:single-stranded DNA-binding protein